MTYDDWQALKQDCFAALHCALPGNVLSFNPETQTAEIRPAVKNFPTLPDVPVFMPVPFEVRMVMMIIAAAPAASATSMLALKYGADYSYGTGLAIGTTIVSMLTMPLVLALAMQLL